jgi:branched-chain amino acid transport system permease protein
MTSAIKAGGLYGIIAVLTVLLFGGWSSVVIGTLVAAAAGLTVCHWQEIKTPREGARLGQLAGLTVGILSFCATFVEGMVVLPAAGEDPLTFLAALKFGGCALIMSVLGGLALGALQGIGPEHEKANLIVLGAFLLIYPFLDIGFHLNLLGWEIHIPGFDLGWIATVIQILIFCMLALGLNIVVGYAGLLDLGYAAFFAIGAYTTGFLSSSKLGIEWNFWIVIWIAAAVAAIAGLILGSPTLRLRGDYLAIVTLGFGEIVPILFRNLTQIRITEPISGFLAAITGNPEIAICLVGCDDPVDLTGGEAGINPIGRPSLPLIGEFKSSDYLPWYFLILGLVVLAVFAINRLRESRVGRAWAAVREDELAASTMGINLVQTKLMAFAMGATFSGFAGAFYASYIRAIFPGVFDFSVSVIILCMVILGGLGNITGVLLGCTIIMAADRLYLEKLAQVLKDVLNTSVLPNIADPTWRDFLATSVDPIQMRLLLFGLTLVIMMIVRPEGLVPNATVQAKFHHKAQKLSESAAEESLATSGVE